MKIQVELEDDKLLEIVENMQDFTDRLDDLIEALNRVERALNDKNNQR
tara:strand:+ start:255 stop:398 length:144 start_codon:yes stop_codon:yes gene_type:complete